MRASLRRALVALLLSVTLAAPAAAAPAMWRIADEDSQVWLFGSVHSFNSRVSWRTAAFNKALRNADLVYFEMRTAVPQGEYMQTMAELGLNPGGKSLGDYLSRAQRQKLAQVIATYGLDADALDAMRPWFAAMTISGATGAQLAAEIRPGVEDTLKREIPRRKERGLDTLETQLRALADLSDRAQVGMLMEAIAGGAEEPDLTQAWLDGDVEGLYGPTAAAFGRPGSEIFEALLTRRNKRWAAQIEKLLAGDQDVMVIVGAAHFGGASGLPLLLRKRGLPIERVQ